MPNLTPNYDFNLPIVNSAIDADIWGAYLNSNWSDLDTLLATVAFLASNNTFTGDNTHDGDETYNGEVDFTAATIVGLPRFQNKQVYTSGSGNWTTPADITTDTVFKVTLIGGGASGSAHDTGVSAGGGGGAGATCIKWISGLSPSTAYAYVVGAGGAAVVTAGNLAGNNGADTTLTIGATTYTAGGGQAPAAPSSFTQLGGAGGTATNGDINIVGGDGAGGFHTGTNPLSGAGGSSSMGGGGSGNTGGNAAGAKAYGSGGGGVSNGSTTFSSGAGGSGLIIIEWVGE